MHPLLAVQKGNPKKITGVKDLLRDDIRVALANPDQAAIGREIRLLLQKEGIWEEIERQVTETGVFKPTVSEVANDIKLGSVDVGIVWDATCKQYPALEPISVPELAPGLGQNTIGVLKRSKDPTAALKASTAALSPRPARARSSPNLAARS